MNIYNRLNKMISYIENNLTETIDYKVLAEILYTNEYVVQRMFSLLTEVTLAEYIRKRRLSKAGTELTNNTARIIDIALKYGYDSPTSFSRAFFKFHGINPSEITNGTVLKDYPIMYFEGNTEVKEELEYKIVEKEEFTLYGIGKKATLEDIKTIAPPFWEETGSNDNPDCNYGLITYEKINPEANATYYICSNKKLEGFNEITIPNSKWIVFKGNFVGYENFQKLLKNIFVNFWPSSGFETGNHMDIEVYHSDSVEYWISIK